MSIKSFFHRIWNDLARELVIAICSMVLASLFYYIFNDFLNVEIKQLSDKMQESFGSSLAYFLHLIAAIYCGRKIRDEKSNPHSIGNAFLALGENPNILKAYWGLRIPTILILYYTPTWFISQRILVNWPLNTSYYVFFLMCCASALSTVFLKKSTILHTSPIYFKSPLCTKMQDPSRALLSWRVKQLLLRNQLSQFCIGLSILSSCLFFLLPDIGPINFLISLVSGLYLAFAFIFQCTLDLKHSWIEKNFGVSHQQYLYNIIIISIGCGLSGACCNSLCYLFAHLFHPLGQEFWQTLIAGFFITFTPVFLVPFAIFQIDGRRAIIQVMSIILASIFICTGIYASLFSIVLLPVVAYYGINSQDGRFYRA